MESPEWFTLEAASLVHQRVQTRQRCYSDKELAKYGLYYLNESILFHLTKVKNDQKV